MRIPSLMTLLMPSVIVGGVLPALIWSSVGLPAHAAEPPMRLQLNIGKMTLNVGERVQIKVEFLDRSYLKVPNDRQRVLELTQVSSAGGGAGDISPAQLTVNRGAQYAVATFTARRPGRVRVRVTSTGLSPSQVPVVIRPQQITLLPEWLLSSVHAQPEITVDIERDGSGPIPANNKSPARLWFIIEAGELIPDKELRIQVRAFPAGARFLYRGEQRPFAEVRVAEGDLTSDEVLLVYSHTQGTLRVVAQLQPQGSRSELELEFELPQHKRIIFQQEHETIKSTQIEMPLTVKLADSDKQLITALDDNVQINLISTTDPDILVFDPQILVLTPEAPFGKSTLQLNALPSGSEILLQALDTEGQLTVGKKTITIESPIRAVDVKGPSKVNRGGKEISLTVSLQGEGDIPLAADWDRKIMISADSGKVFPPEVVIPRGQEQANVTYQSSDSVGEVTVSAKSRGIESGTWKVSVVTAAYVLVLFAGLGGVLGGLSRRILVVGVTEIWPKWRQGRLEIGLVGNALFSFLFGLVLFQGVKLGVVAGLDSLGGSEGFYAGTRTFAFFFGVLGGFGGTFVLHRLLRRVFPESRPMNPNP